MQTGAHAAQNFQSLGSLHAANHPHQRRQDTQGSAPRFFKRLASGKDAGIAGGLRILNVVHRHLTIQAQGRTRDQGLGMLHAGQVNGVAGFKVVGAIEHHIGQGHALRKQQSVCPLRQCAHLHLGVDLVNGRLERGHFELSHAVLGVAYLPL